MMVRPLVGLLSAFAVLGTGVAVWAGPNFSIAVPAATLALASAALLFVEAWAYRTPPFSVRFPSIPPSPTYGLRGAFRSGHMGRETIVETLDRLERAGPNPELPVRGSEENRRIYRMPEREFREYLRERLDRLERRS